MINHCDRLIYEKHRQLELDVTAERQHPAALCGDLRASQTGERCPPLVTASYCRMRLYSAEWRGERFRDGSEILSASL